MLNSIMKSFFYYTPTALIIIIILFVPRLHAQEPELAGQASVIDGDTIEIGYIKIRLHGIDAPESTQWCYDQKSVQYPCGRRAAIALSDFIGRGTVSCQPHDIDRYGRTIAKCRVRGLDIEKWLVKNGHAVAYRKYSSDYVADEIDAKSNQVGIWSGFFELPSNFRHHKRH